MPLFRRRPRAPTLEERLTGYRAAPVSAEAAAPRVEAMFSELGLAPHAREDVENGWTLETDAGRVTAVLDRDDSELRLFHFFADADEAPPTKEAYAELLEVNAGLDGAHYCLIELDRRRYLALRALVCHEALELPALALALESLLRQARQTVPEGEPGGDPRFAVGDALAARGGVLPTGGAEAALREGAVTTEDALAALELDWRKAPDSVHDWRITTEFGDLQVFLRPEGTSVVVRLPLERMTPDGPLVLFERFVEKSGEERAYCALTDIETGEGQLWVQAVVSAQAIRPPVLAYAIEAVLTQARSWIEA